MKKKISIVILLFILFVPIPSHLKDGGTVEYKALTYKVTKVHRLIDVTGYEDGLRIEIFGLEIYNNVKETHIQKFNQEELKTMALEYFLKRESAFLKKEEYTVGISDNIPNNQDQDMVMIEIRHINNHSNNTLDARYYINIYTAKGFDDLKNEIDLNGLE